MGISSEDVVELYHERRKERGWQIDRMLRMQRQVNGDVMVPMPELEMSEKPGVANLIVIGLDAFSQRVGSVMPDIYCPPLRPGIGASEEKARQRRLAMLGWQDMNKFPIKIRHRARFLLGYGCGPVTIHPVSTAPSDKRKMPFWRVRNPLSAFPAPMDDHNGDIEPADYVLVHRYSLGWLENNYPEETKVLYKGRSIDQARDTMFEVLEYNDEDETVLVAIGAQRPMGERSQEPGLGSAENVQLGKSIPNRAQVCNMVCPGRITLDKISGQFDAMIHLFASQAKMAAYEELAMFRSIFPEEWVTSHPNAPSKPKIVRMANAKDGTVGLIENGTIQPISLQPGAQVPTAIDRIERSLRLTGQIPAEMGGESGSNIRTAKRGEMVLSAGVDQPLQEIQEILAASIMAEDERAIATMKGFFGSRPTSFYLPKNGTVPRNDYVPNTAFETDYHVIKYSFPGSDSASLPIEIGQRVGTGEMSLQTAREMDPAIDDPVLERNRVEMEGYDRALLSGLEQAALQPGYDPTIIAKMSEYRAANPGAYFHDVYLAVHAQLQADQAQQQAATLPPGGAPPGPDVAGGSPPPGAGMPGAGPQPPGGPPAIGPPSASQADLSSVLATLRRPSNQGPAERQVGAQQTAGANA